MLSVIYPQFSWDSTRLGTLQYIYLNYHEPMKINKWRRFRVYSPPVIWIYAAAIFTLSPTVVPTQTDTSAMTTDTKKKIQPTAYKMAHTVHATLGISLKLVKNWHRLIMSSRSSSRLQNRIMPRATGSYGNEDNDLSADVLDMARVLCWGCVLFSNHTGDTKEKQMPHVKTIVMVIHNDVMQRPILYYYPEFFLFYFYCYHFASTEMIN